MKPLRPIEKIYHFLVGTKNFLYDRKIIKPIQLKFPVVSIGNISFGGVGKTPFILLLAEELSTDRKVNIVTKSYKAALTEPQKVDLSIATAAGVFGDEACLLQQKLPQCTVWSGPNKASTAAASSISQPDVILIDDGFSHRRLCRNFDLVLIDATEGLDGYLRESRGNIRRATAVVITKTNLVDAAELVRIETDILETAPHLKYNIFKSAVTTTVSVDKSEPLFIFCGLGRPETFYIDLIIQGYHIVNKLFYPDHFSYPEAEQKNIFEKYVALKVLNKNLKLITTEKDFVKICYGPLKEILQIPVHMVTMAIEEKEILLEKIRQSL